MSEPFLRSLPIKCLKVKQGPFEKLYFQKSHYMILYTIIHILSFNEVNMQGFFTFEKLIFTEVITFSKSIKQNIYANTKE